MRQRFLLHGMFELNDYGTTIMADNAWNKPREPSPSVKMLMCIQCSGALVSSSFILQVREAAVEAATVEVAAALPAVGVGVESGTIVT